MTPTSADHSQNFEDLSLPGAVDRPPGGTARGGGTKTPRKVQWAVDSRQVDAGSSAHALDEQGLDPNPFETLKDALERHKSTSDHHIPRPINMDSQSEPPSHGSPPFSPTHQVPGEIYIDPHEKAGLPGTDLSKYSKAEASKVVGAHKRGIFGSRDLRQKKRDQQGDTNREARKTSLPSALDDVEKEGLPNYTHSVGTGLLSALLSLYDHQRSGMSTPASTMSFDRESDALSFDLPAVNYDNRHSAKSSTYTKDGTRTSTFQSRRPKERNGAGVFGALIASTGNISGAAAPTSATLAPDLKRPGYHLSRYSLESNLPTKKHPNKLPSRPQSTHFESFSTPTAGAHISADSSPDTESPDATSTTTTTLATKTTSLATRRRWSGMLKDLPNRGWNSSVNTPSSGTPTNTEHDEWFADEKSGDDIRRDRRRKRKKAEVYITRHVAEIIQRQEFILKFVRAMMMFGGPSHRFHSQIQSTAKVLDINLSCMYLPDVMLISFDDAATGTSNIKLIRQASALDLGKLQLAYDLYWKVIHDQISVKEVSSDLDELMRRPPLYNWWQLILIGGFCSAWICSVGFYGSFADSLLAFPMGALLVSVQLVSVRNELYSNVFEITIATLLSFLSAAFASTHIFCYSAIASASVVLILPGFIVLIGSLELSSRNIVSGAVRLCFACVYSLFLGFGLAIGLEVYQKLTGKVVYGASDYMCVNTHTTSSSWWQKSPSTWWAFLTVPMYSLFLSLRNQAPWNKKEMPLLVIISCIGWVTNHFVSTQFPNQSDISAAIGAFAVGFVANVYGRFFRGNAFVIMITGILFQLPSGLGNGGLLSYASMQTSGQSTPTTYLSGFQTALQLISVAIGLTVGLGISLVVVHPIQPRRRAGGVFSL